jgi:peptidoglycan/xylan/chitin deacetylase (PgdA/CDA1 family)
MKPRPYGPFPYSPIIRRPKLTWPEGARVALWVIPNVEFFSLEERPAGYGAAAKIPDVVMWSDRDYGNRVGVWRLMEVLDRYKIRASVALNSLLCDHHPVIIEEGNKRKWEWMGHNESNTRRLNEAPPGEEAQIINRTFATIERATGDAAKRLAQFGAAGNLGFARSPGRGGLPIRMRLVQRRSTLHYASGRRLPPGLDTLSTADQRQARL